MLHNVFPRGFATSTRDGLMSSEDKEFLNFQIPKKIEEYNTIIRSLQSKDEELENNHTLLNQEFSSYVVSSGNYIKQVEELANTALQTAQDKVSSIVFDTKASLDAWLKVEENSSSLKIGTNLLIREVDTPDYWWDGTTIQILETQKVDLSNYLKSTGGTITGDITMKADFLYMIGTNIIWNAADHPDGVFASGLLYFNNMDTFTLSGGIGADGANGAVNSLYMAYGEEPYNDSAIGVHIKSTGTLITGDLKVTGNLTAPTFIGNLQGNADNASYVGTKWTSITKVGSYSRLCKLTGAGNYILNIMLSQNAQVSCNSFIIGVSHLHASIKQIGATGYKYNYNQIVRIVCESDGGQDVHYVEVLNDYGYNGTTATSVNCRLITLYNNLNDYCTTYTEYTPTTDTVTEQATVTCHHSNFVGDLNGTATKATQDSAGQQIDKTYIKGLSVSGKTITYTRGDNTTGTINTQDTTYTLASFGITATADDINGFKTNYLPLSGGTMTGDIYPTNEMLQLGSGSKAWYNVYANTLTLQKSSVNFGSLTINSVGTTSTPGSAILQLGNNIAAGTANNACGSIILYGYGTGYVTISPAHSGSSNISITLPSTSGMVALTSQVLLNTGGKITGDLEVTGTITGSKVYNAVWNDYAEYFERGEETEVGDIIALSLDSDNETYIKAINGDIVCGVHSDTYGHIVGGRNVPADYESTFEEYNDKNFIPVGMIGRVYCKVIGSVNKGDKIYASNIPGVGVSYNEDCKEESFVGYACESYNSDTIGKIKILLRK